MRERLMKKNEQTGFTIIEVVLVLAIAGLIFLIVFLALPQLQRSRRDTQRRTDAGRFLAAAENWSSNNNGTYPTPLEFNTVVSDYIIGTGGSFADPSSGNNYTNSNPASPVSGQMRYARALVCSGSNAIASAGNNRNVAVVVFQESGGTYCQDNQ